MDTIVGIDIFPVISFIIFFIFFLVLFVWVYKMNKSEIEFMAAMPLAEDDELTTAQLKDNNNEN